MANLKSSLKDIRRIKKRNVVNSRLKKRIKRASKAFLGCIKEKDKEGAEKLHANVQKVLDKAAKKGVIKKGTASRKKSRLAKKLKTL